MGNRIHGRGRRGKDGEDCVRSGPIKGQAFRRSSWPIINPRHAVYRPSSMTLGQPLYPLRLRMLQWLIVSRILGKEGHVLWERHGATDPAICVAGPWTNDHRLQVACTG